MSRFGYESYDFDNPEEVIRGSPYELIDTDGAIRFGRKENQNSFERMMSGMVSFRLPGEETFWNKVGGFLEDKIDLQALGAYDAGIVYDENAGLIHAMDRDAERYLDQQKEVYGE